MAKEDSGEMRELSGRELNGNVLVLRLAKKEVKKEEEEQPKSIGKGIEEGEVINGDNGQGNAASSVSDDQSQQFAVNTIIPLPNDPPQLSVKVEKEGDSMVEEELKQLRQAAVTNERTLKDKEMLLSMLTAKLEEVRKEKKAGEQQLMAEIGVREETSRQCMELERRLFEEQQKNGQLIEELKLAQEKPNNVDKEAVTETTTDDSVDKETSMTLQPSRAAVAAQLLGVNVQLLEKPQPNDWKEKFELLNIKYLKMKKMFRAEQKVAARLRRQLLQDKQNDDATSEELYSLAQFGAADREEPIESNEAAVSSPAVQSKIQLSARMRRQLMEEQMDFELPPEEEEDGEEGREKVMATGVSRFRLVATRRSAKATTVRGRRHQLLDEGKGQKPALAPSTRRLEKENGAANVPASGGGVFKCQQCPPNKMAFSSAQRLADHEKRLHGVRQQHCRRQCPECGRPCVDGVDRRRHMRLHTGEKPFKCQQCGRGFSQKGNLTVHKRVHTGERPFVCSVCQKAFTSSSNLTGHLRVHSGETPYSCQHCAKQFKQVGDCRRHEKTCPGQQPPTCD